MQREAAASSAQPQNADDLETMVARARRGDHEVLPQFRAFLDDHPEVWQRPGDLARLAMESWINLIAGTDLAAREALIRKAESLGAELAGPLASHLEKLLVERIVACWLQVHYSDIAVTQVKDVSLRQAAFAQKRQDAAHRRYLSAIGALAMIRRLTLSAIEPTRLQAQSEPMVDPTDNAATMTNLVDRDHNFPNVPDAPASLVVFDPSIEGASPGARNKRSSRKRITSAS